MYSVYAKKGETSVCIYNDKYVAPETLSLSPTLELGESSAGSFKIKLPPDNNGYTFINRLDTEIIVYRDDDEIWSGRVVSEDTDFWKNRKIECEGELAYLNDTIQPQAEFHDITPHDLLEAFLTVHNQNATSDKQFTLGTVTVTDPNDSLYRYTNYESTLEAINNKLLEKLGGYLSIRKENGVRYLDYLATHPDTNQQPIRFGVNMLDFTKTFESTNFCTVVLPLGQMVDEEHRTLQIDALEQYLTVESVNEGSPYIINQTAYEAFGWIAKVVHWDNVTQPSILKSKAEAYLTDQQFDDMELEIKAVDLHYTDEQINAIKISEQIRVISEPHGLDRVFPVTKMSIPLDNPSDTAFVIGNKIKVGFTEKSVNATAELSEKIENLPSASSILSGVKKRALELLLSETQGGYVVYEYDQNNQYIIAINICNELTIEESTKRWRWSQNGFGYMYRNTKNDSWTGPSVALTMDGSIIANFITSGTMSADRIRGGTLIAGGRDDTNGVISVRDDYNGEIGRWDQFGLYATKASFGGTIDMNGINVNGAFTVGNTGRTTINEKVTVNTDGNTKILQLKNSNSKYVELDGEKIYAYGAAQSVKWLDLINDYLSRH